MTKNRFFLRFIRWFRRIDKVFWLLMLSVSVFSLLLLKSVSRATNTDYFQTQLIVTLVGFSAAALLSCLFSFGLAFLCRRENRRSFRL